MNLSHTINIGNINYLGPLNINFTPSVIIWIYENLKENLKILDVIFLYRNQDEKSICNYTQEYSCFTSKEKEILDYLIKNDIVEIKMQICKTYSNVYKIQLTKQMLLALI